MDDILTDEVRAFVAANRIAHLATADRNAHPHVVPVCFATEQSTVFITIDQKPKRGLGLKRLKNIAENPSVAIVVDRYSDEWDKLGWVMIHGRAEILLDGREHDRAQELLRARYSQLLAMAISSLPVISVRIERVTTWGNLAAERDDFRPKDRQ